MTDADRGLSSAASVTKKWLPYLLIFAVSALIFLLHGLDRAEFRLMDFRFDTLSRPGSGDLTVVAIDSKSLRELDAWPWPRDYHAKVIRTLIEGGAERIAFAVDFSSRSSPQADHQLRDALAFAAEHGRPVILPLFKQFKDPAKPGEGLILTQPIPMLAGHADMAFTNVRPSADSLIRQIQFADRWQDETYLTLAARLAGVTEARPTLFFIDYGIDAASIPRVSFSDLYFGRVDVEAFRGKNVLVGATAVELGDQMAVPRYRSLPGPMVEALTFESIVQHRTINRLGILPVLVVTFLVSVLGGPWLASLTWRQALPLLAGFTLLCVGAAHAVQWLVPVSVDISPWLLAAALAFLFGLLRNIDHHVFRAFISSMAASHTRAVMRGMIENSFDGVVVVNGQGFVEMFNPAAARMFQTRASDVIGLTAESFFAESGGEALQGLKEMVEELSTPQDDAPRGRLREMELSKRDGTVFPAEVAVSRTALRVSGSHPNERRTLQRGALVYIIRDITERRDAEQKERQLRSELAHASRLTTMGEMAAGIAHEVNQPLTAINNYAGGLRRLIANEPLDMNRALESLDLISAQTQRAGGIIRRIRGFARKEEQDRQAVAINPAISEALDLVLADSLGQKVKVIRELAPNLPPVFADTIQIQQVVVNLVRNALEAVAMVDHHSESGREGAVRVLSRNAGSGQIQVIIADTGIGIPADAVERLFEPFFSTKDSGMGIGLIMCKSIVEDHGGEIRVESVEGLGTTVSFTLPVAPAR